MIFSEFYAALMQSHIKPNDDCPFSTNSAANQLALYLKVSLEVPTCWKLPLAEKCVGAKNRKECVSSMTYKWKYGWCGPTLTCDASNTEPLTELPQNLDLKHMLTNCCSSHVCAYDFWRPLKNSSRNVNTGKQWITDKIITFQKAKLTCTTRWLGQGLLTDGAS